MPQRATPADSGFNPHAAMPYQLRPADFALALQDLYDFLFDVNSALQSRDLPRLEDTVRPAVFSGILSDMISASLARHSRVLRVNHFHNGHPDLIPGGRYPIDAVASGDEGVEVKATKGSGAVDAHGARPGLALRFPVRRRFHDRTRGESIAYGRHGSIARAPFCGRFPKERARRAWNTHRQPEP